MRKMPRVPWVWLGGIGVVGAWAGVSALAWMNGELTGTAMLLDGELALARKAGLPVEASEIQNGPAVPDQVNAASDILQATEELRIVRGQSTPRPWTTTSSLDPDWDEIEKDLPRYARAVRLLHEAAERPACDFRRRYDLGWDLMFPELSSMRRFTDLLGAEARLAAKRGQIDAAFDDLEASAHLVQLVGRSPDLISWSSSVRAQASTLENLSGVLWLVPINSHVLERSKRVTEILKAPPDVKNAYRGDLVLWRAGLHQLAKQARAPLNVGMWPKELDDPILRSPTGLRAVETRLVTVCRRIYIEMPTGPSDLKRAKQAIDDLEFRESVHSGKSWIMSKQHAEGAKRIIREYAGWIAYHRLAATAIRLLEIRLKTGKLPAKLPAIEECIDPLAEAPFTYRPSPERLELYSVGPDGYADGGRRRDIRRSGGYDNVFEVPLNRIGKP